MEKDLYSILGVDKNATKDELKKQYRKLSKQYHPDMQNGKSESQKKEAEEKFKDINAAYAVLSDDEKRRHYDQFGSVENGSPFGNGGSGFDPFDFFRSHFAGNPFGDGFGFSDFGGRGHKTDSFNDPEDGSDILVRMTVSFQDMVYGVAKDFDFDKTSPCEECGGTGVEKGTTPSICTKCNGDGRIVHTVRHGFMMSQTISDCPECHGTGKKMTTCKHCNGQKRKTSKQHISVKIPMGVMSGQKLRVAGAGQCGLKGGSDGNLYIQILVDDCPNDVFKRISNLDIEMEYPIDPITATFGGNVEVCTLWGKTNVEIPANAHDGTAIVLPNFGLKDSTHQGKLILKLHIAPFTKLSNAQKEILTKFKETTTKSNTYGLVGLENNIAQIIK